MQLLRGRVVAGWLLPLCPRSSPRCPGALPAGAGGARQSPRAPAPGWVAIHGRGHGEGSLLARERKAGYREPCAAPIAPSATELLQLPRWISADKEGALDTAGIQLADGCRSRRAAIQPLQSLT